MLHTCLQRQRRLMPDAPQEELIRHAAKRLVPHTVPGSPAFHRTALNDLLAIVDSRGVPSLFLTLTADEATGMRWAEVDEMEALLQKTVRNDDLSWRDMPVEMARLFHDRVTNFIHTALLDPDNPILGKITDYTVRYESQVRQGCLLPVQAANQIAALRHTATPAPHTAAPHTANPCPCSTAAPCMRTSSSGWMQLMLSEWPPRSPPRAASTRTSATTRRTPSTCLTCPWPCPARQPVPRQSSSTWWRQSRSTSAETACTAASTTGPSAPTASPSLSTTTARPLMRRPTGARLCFWPQGAAAPPAAQSHKALAHAAGTSTRASAAGTSGWCRTTRPCCCPGGRT